MADVNPYKDVQDDAERLTKARLEAAKPSAESNDLKIVPMVQATTPNDETAKKANTGGVDVSGSPERFTGPVSDGFVDGAVEEAAAPKKASK
jgi:hypothetical protein